MMPNRSVPMSARALALVEFQEAMQRGCTIPELRAAKAREQHVQALARLEARVRACGRRDEGATASEKGLKAPSTPSYWWQKED